MLRIAITISFLLLLTLGNAQEHQEPNAEIPDGISLLNNIDRPKPTSLIKTPESFAAIHLGQPPEGIFCKWEDQLNAKAKFPIAIRLHSFEHAERMDGKRSW